MACLACALGGGDCLGGILKAEVRPLFPLEVVASPAWPSLKRTSAMFTRAVPDGVWWQGLGAPFCLRPPSLDRR